VTETLHQNVHVLSHPNDRNLGISTHGGTSFDPGHTATSAASFTNTMEAILFQCQYSPVMQDKPIPTPQLQLSLDNLDTERLFPEATSTLKHIHAHLVTHDTKSILCGFGTTRPDDTTNLYVQSYLPHTSLCSDEFLTLPREAVTLYRLIVETSNLMEKPHPVILDLARSPGLLVNLFTKEVWDSLKFCEEPLRKRINEVSFDPPSFNWDPSELDDVTNLLNSVQRNEFPPEPNPISLFSQLVNNPSAGRIVQQFAITKGLAPTTALHLHGEHLLAPEVLIKDYVTSNHTLQVIPFISFVLSVKTRLPISFSYNGPKRSPS